MPKKEAEEEKVEVKAEEVILCEVKLQALPASQGVMFRVVDEAKGESMKTYNRREAVALLEGQLAKHV